MEDVLFFVFCFGTFWIHAGQTIRKSAALTKTSGCKYEILYDVSFCLYLTLRKC